MRVIMKRRDLIGEKAAVVPSGIMNINAAIAIIVLFLESFSEIVLLSSLMTCQSSWFYYENNRHDDENNDVLKERNEV